MKNEGELEQTQLQLNNFFCIDKLKFIFRIFSNNFLGFIFSCFLWFGLSFLVDLHNQPFRALVVWCVTHSYFKLWMLQLFYSLNSLSCDTHSQCVTGSFLHSRKKLNIFSVNIQWLIEAKIRTVWRVWTPHIWAPNLISTGVTITFVVFFSLFKQSFL